SPPGNSVLILLRGDLRGGGKFLGVGFELGFALGAAEHVGLALVRRRRGLGVDRERFFRNRTEGFGAQRGRGVERNRRGRHRFGIGAGRAHVSFVVVDLGAGGQQKQTDEQCSHRESSYHILANRPILSQNNPEVRSLVLALVFAPALAHAGKPRSS